jgi:hypothetical protein
MENKVVLGVDVAKPGGDKTIYAVRKDNNFLYCGEDAEKASEVMREHQEEEEDGSPDFDSDDDLRKMYGSSLAHAHF